MSDGKLRNEFLCGFACALANLNRLFDVPSKVEDIMNGAGLSVIDLEAGGVEEYDLSEIRKAIAPLEKTEE